MHLASPIINFRDAVADPQAPGQLQNEAKRQSLLDRVFCLGFVGLPARSQDG
jgi:hypothetical protein